MVASTLIYLGAVAALVALIRRRWRVVLAALLLVVVGFVLPAPESRVTRAQSRLDEFMPRWQFHEVHTRRIAAPPERVFAAVRAIRADEIALFRTLTWIRRGGRDLPESILDAGRDPLLDVATRSGFVWLALDPPRELVVGTAVIRPRGSRTTPELFRTRPPGHAIAAMNFVVRPDGRGGSIVSTETRIDATDAHSHRRFKTYWRMIYPGSALIRRMWLRAVERRATAATAAAAEASGRHCGGTRRSRCRKIDAASAPRTPSRTA